jgi:N-carbamoyl-L-amino-acid hydrolase
VDAVGNVVGALPGDRPNARDTADRQPLRHRAQRWQVRRTAGHLRADGLRAGNWHRQGRACPSTSRWSAFAEEEGQRYKATFLGSGALVGQFNPSGSTRRTPTALRCARPCSMRGCASDDIAALRRNPQDYLGFVEVHIEQGPVLNEIDLPLGIVTSINGSVRYLCEVIGTACHAGTTPMDRRSDAAAAVAEVAAGRGTSRA